MPKKLLLGLLLFFNQTYADHRLSDQELHLILAELKASDKHNLPARLDQITKHWLKRPYCIYGLGEGETSEFDQHPLYRTDCFDCQTFVETALSLAQANDLPQFKHTMNQIRYQRGQVHFIHRHHFTNVDWNQGNRHLIENITAKIKYHGHSISKISTTVINKKGWYQNLAIDRIFLRHADELLRQEKLKKLRNYAQLQGEFVSQLNYIPLAKLFDQQGRAIIEIFNQIPSGSIIQIVTPKSHTVEKIGTDLDISHMGFVFHQQGKVYFRHASALHQQIEELPLQDYLKNFLHHPIIKGIHIEFPQSVDQ